MSNIKISALGSASALDGTEEVPIVQSSTTVKTTTQDIANLGGGASYLVYTALLSQSGTDAPVATILQNTLGGVPVYTYDSDGVYTITLAGVFLTNKTAVFCGQTNFAVVICGTNEDDNSLFLITVTNLGGASTNDKLSFTPIEIRVYP